MKKTLFTALVTAQLQEGDARIHAHIAATALLEDWHPASM